MMAWHQSECFQSHSFKNASWLMGRSCGLRPIEKPGRNVWTECRWGMCDIFLWNMLIQVLDHRPRTRKSNRKGGGSWSPDFLSQPAPRFTVPWNPSDFRDQYATKRFVKPLDSILLRSRAGAVFSREHHSSTWRRRCNGFRWGYRILRDTFVSGRCS